MVMLHASVHLWQEIYLSGRLLDTLLPAPSLPLGWPRQWPRQHWRLLLKEQCLIFIAGSTEKVSSQAVRYSAMCSALLCSWPTVYSIYLWPYYWWLVFLSLANISPWHLEPKQPIWNHRQENWVFVHHLSHESCCSCRRSGCPATGLLVDDQGPGLAVRFTAAL
jgi:hypothetical protein